MHVTATTTHAPQIGHVDWDMFQSTHPDGEMHAAARAVGGSPVYVSDRPDAHNFALLRKLVLPDGSVLRCRGAGRPTRDVLFSDVNADGVTALKIWNVNSVTGLVGAFNVQGAKWDRTSRAFVPCEEPEAVAYEVRPSDVEGLSAAAAAAADTPTEARGAAGDTGDTGGGRAAVSAAASGDAEGDAGGFIDGEATGASGLTAVYSHRRQEVSVLAGHESTRGVLGRREWELYTLSPVLTAGGASWAPFGLSGMLNGGGAVLSATIHMRFRLVQASVTMRASGNFVGYCRPAPREVKVDGIPVTFEHDGVTGTLRVPMQRKATPIEMTVWMPRRATAS